MGDPEATSCSGAAPLETRNPDKVLTTENNVVQSPPLGASYDLILTPNEVDQRLMLHPDGVNLALDRVKVWSKYAKDVIAYIEKKTALESECARNLSKLAQTTRPVLMEESFLPFQNIYCLALDQDQENAKNHLNICSKLQGQKFIERLSEGKAKAERKRKEFKEIWQKELKKMQEAVVNLRKADTCRKQRIIELEKLKEAVLKLAASVVPEDAARLERKKKMEEDAHQKLLEAEVPCMNFVMEANYRQKELEKVKARVLEQVRELIYQCDQTMKAVTVNYLQLQQAASVPSPVQLQMLCEKTRIYEPGAQYMEFVRQLPVPTGQPIHKIQFFYEPYQSMADKWTESVGDSSEECLSTEDSKDLFYLRRYLFHGPSVATVAATGGSDSDSLNSFHSNKSQESPTASPYVQKQKGITVAATSNFEVVDAEPDLREDSRNNISRAAETHKLKKLRTPSKCRECDTYVYFHGIECVECGLACHKKCLESLAIKCGHKRLARRMTTFGVSLDHDLSTVTLPENSHDHIKIPVIVLKCIEEIERRGIFIKGIYRVSGVKSKVEKLCQSFESGPKLVDLSEAHPNVIANVLKLYFRQLPEPLLTFKLYSQFIQVAKDHPNQQEGNLEKVTKELTSLVSQLPPVHLATLAVLIFHLKKVSEYSEDNHMPPSNLGIVFGPTLLRTKDGSASLASLVDTAHQTKVVELLIKSADTVLAKNSQLKVHSSSPSKPSPPTQKDDIEEEEEEDEEEEDEDDDDDDDEEIEDRDDELYTSFLHIKNKLKCLPQGESTNTVQDNCSETSVFLDEEPLEVLSLQEIIVKTSKNDSNLELLALTPRKTARDQEIPLSLSIPSSSDQDSTSTAEILLPGKTNQMTPSVAELRRQFFESPPVVLKDVACSLPTSPTPSSVDLTPDFLRTVKELASENHTRGCSLTTDKASDTVPSHSKESSEKDYDEQKAVLSPLTSSISELGLKPLRPVSTFQLNSAKNQPQIRRHVNGKWNMLDPCTRNSYSIGGPSVLSRKEMYEDSKELTSAVDSRTDISNVPKAVAEPYTIQDHLECTGNISNERRRKRQPRLV